MGENAKNAFQRTFLAASRDFALMLAQRGLGRERDPSKPGALRTRIESDYLHGPGFDQGRGIGVDGIAKIKVRMNASGYSFDHFSIAGLNTEMTHAVYERASGKVGKLGIPTEIELDMTWSRDRALLVVDENGKLRFSWQWQAMTSAGAPPLAAMFWTPEKAWAKLAGDKIPNTFGRGSK